MKEDVSVKYYFAKECIVLYVKSRSSAHVHQSLSSFQNIGISTDAFVHILYIVA